MALASPAPSPDPAPTDAPAPQPPPKRKPSRRANTAERRATHNAVERQRRETLNGRFLDLAALLPNLSQIRRPSKSSIVNSSIAYIHAARRHRQLAARELRLLKGEADALRRELNEWRDRAGLPRIEDAVRSDAFAIIVSGEIDVLVAEVGAEMAAQGHGHGPMMDDDDDDDWGAPPPSQPFQPQHFDDHAYAPVQHPQQLPVNMAHIQHQPQMNLHPAQFAYQQVPFSDDDRAFLKASNPFAHNVPRPQYDHGNAAGALYTPPATRDGRPATSTGGSSPTHSSRSANSARNGASPASSHGHNAPSPPPPPRFPRSASPHYELANDSRGPRPRPGIVPVDIGAMMAYNEIGSYSIQHHHPGGPALYNMMS